MLLCRILGINCPFITVIERNDRRKTRPTNEFVMLPPIVSEVPQKKNPEKYDMICLSNAEDIVFYTCSSQCLLNEMNVSAKPPVNYDSYLDYFE